MKFGKHFKAIAPVVYPVDMTKSCEQFCSDVCIDFLYC